MAIQTDLERIELCNFLSRQTLNLNQIQMKKFSSEIFGLKATELKSIFEVGFPHSDLLKFLLLKFWVKTLSLKSSSNG